MPGRYFIKDTDKELSMWKKKQRLRSIWKQYKCGLIQWEQINEEDKLLLIRYYHVDEP